MPKDSVIIIIIVIIIMIIIISNLIGIIPPNNLQLLEQSCDKKA